MHNYQPGLASRAQLWRWRRLLPRTSGGHEHRDEGWRAGSARYERVSLRQSQVHGRLQQQSCGGSDSALGVTTPTNHRNPKTFRLRLWTWAGTEGSR